MDAPMENYRFTADWFGGHIPNWQEWLGHLAGKPELRFLEVGCYEGRSVVWLLGNILTHETARIECVDVFFDDASGSSAMDSYEQRFDHNIKTALGRKKVRKIKAPSQEWLRKLPLHSYDAIYVDGSHTAPDVLEDAVLAFRLLSPGGVMIFDDYEWNAYPDPWLTPRMGIDFFLRVYERQYELLSKGYQVAIRKTLVAS
jgi:predicted O-methyltransferase YrrM